MNDVAMVSIRICYKNAGRGFQYKAVPAAEVLNAAKKLSKGKGVSLQILTPGYTEDQWVWVR